MKTLLLTTGLSLMVASEVMASATVRLDVEKEGGELKIIHNQTQAGFMERGLKNVSGRVKYFAEPGPYTMTGTTPDCPVVTQSVTFEEGKDYTFRLTEDCRIESL